MRVELDRDAAKKLDRLNQPVWGRIRKALKKLELEPPEGDIKKLIGRDGYRVRVGDYRILFDYVTVIEKDKENKDYELQIISVEDIEPRGGAYKGKGNEQ